MTHKQRERAVKKAVAAMDKAAEALEDLQSICIEHGVDITREQSFKDGLKERADYWERCTWYKRGA